MYSNSTFTDIHFSDFCSFIFEVPVEKVVKMKKNFTVLRQMTF